MLPRTAQDIAQLCGGELRGDGSCLIHSVAPLETAGPYDLAFAAAGASTKQVAQSAAGCILVSDKSPPPEYRTVIRVPEPRAAFAKLLGQLFPARPRHLGIDKSAVLAPTVSLGANLFIGPNVAIDAGTLIGDNSHIAAGAVIGADVTIGPGCYIGANVTIYDHVTIGARCIIHAGAVIGADGFGYVWSGTQYERFPQIGRVQIGDDVELGANCCIDRAALGVTEIGDGTKLDNLVHIGHNCCIGRHVVIAAQTGLSGGVTIGDYAVIGGQVGMGDKARIEPRAVIGSQAGVLPSKIVRSGDRIWGTPARPLPEVLRQQALLSRLHIYLDTLTKKLEELERDSPKAGMPSSQPPRFDPHSHDQ